MTLERRIADEPGLPRRNGELVFDEPWQSRSFGLAVALDAAGIVPWERFRAELIDEIASWGGEGDAAWSYYERWHAALERLLVEEGVVTPAELERHAHEIAHERAHDHDHDHV